jgi:hypothetical protein
VVVVVVVVMVAAAAAAAAAVERLISGSKFTHTGSSTQVFINVTYPEKSILHFIQEVLY